MFFFFSCGTFERVFFSGFALPFSSLKVTAEVRHYMVLLLLLFLLGEMLVSVKTYINITYVVDAVLLMI